MMRLIAGMRWGGPDVDVGNDVDGGPVVDGGDDDDGGPDVDCGDDDDEDEDETNSRHGVALM